MPKEITTGVDISGVQSVTNSADRFSRQIHHYTTPLPVYFNFLSSMFMHGDIMHIFGNMLFLWIFGDNIENLIGHIRYGIFYIVCGIAAALAQIILGPDSIIPMLGASGAISGVLGAYMLLFPTRKVRALIFQNYHDRSGVCRARTLDRLSNRGWIFNSVGTGGVAYAAHIGGFIAGLVLIKLFALGTKAQDIKPLQG